MGYVTVCGVGDYASLRCWLVKMALHILNKNFYLKELCQGDC